MSKRKDRKAAREQALVTQPDSHHHDQETPKRALNVEVGNPFRSLITAWNSLPRLLDVLKDNRGKMSSKRFGAGALVASGIALVNAGADDGSGMHFYGGLALAALGVVLFALTRYEPGKR